MVFMFEHGRLGNQLFQYVALRAAFAQHRLVFFGFDALQQAFDCPRTHHIRQTHGRRHLMMLLRWTLQALAALRLIGEAGESRQGGGCSLRQRRGLLPGLVYLREGFFQHAAFEPQIPPTLALRPAWQQAAQRQWSAPGWASEGRPRVFVHVRRGDYLSFPSPEFPAVLPDDWTLAAMQAFRDAGQQPLFVVCSDDLAYARRMLAGHGDVLFCEGSELEDFAVMAACDGGILSASSYSWWAAWLARSGAAARGQRSRFIAPRYWVGHRQARWYPEGLQSAWMEYR